MLTARTLAEAQIYVSLTTAADLEVPASEPAPLQPGENLLEGPDGLAVGRPCQGLLPRLPAVRQGLVPHLAPQSMVRQAFDLG